jgi:hypothetical protein
MIGTGTQVEALAGEFHRRIQMLESRGGQK